MIKDVCIENPNFLAEMTMLDLQQLDPSSENPGLEVYT